MITILNINSDQNNHWTNRQSRKKKCLLFGISITTLILMFCVAMPLIVTFNSPTTAIRTDLEPTSTTATNTAIVTDSITSSILATSTSVTTAIITTITTTTVSTTITTTTTITTFITDTSSFTETSSISTSTTITITETTADNSASTTMSIVSAPITTTITETTADTSASTTMSIVSASTAIIITETTVDNSASTTMPTASTLTTITITEAIADTNTLTTMTVTTISTTTTTTTTTSTSTTTSTRTTTSTTRTTTTTTTSTSSRTTSSSTSSTTSWTTTTTTRQRSLVILTNPGDTIVGLYNTPAGGDAGGINGYYPSNSEGPASAIDNNIGTKYLNFGGANCVGCFSTGAGVNTGFFVVPLISKTTIARALRFATANDFPNRDPITVTLEGSNAATVNMLYGGSSWTLIYSGPTGISATVDPGRNVSVSQQNFLNTTPYLAYRLLITSQRGNANSVQYAESLILGYV